jgi:hypothetical protein
VLSLADQVNEVRRGQKKSLQRGKKERKLSNGIKAAAAERSGNQAKWSIVAFHLIDLAVI